MSLAGTVVYEVALDLDGEIEAALDTWLRDHIADMLQLPGFLSAEVLSEPAAVEGRARRVVRYRLRDQAALDAYLAEHASRMRADGAERFGDGFSAERRVLAHREELVRGTPTENCRNCGEVLLGQHCARCGQAAQVRVLSLGELVRDALGDLTNLDSRVWRTLIPLALRPGLVTQEYLRGRRASYSPPVRLYLVLSVAFFLLGSFLPDDEPVVQLSRNGAPAPASTPAAADRPSPEVASDQDCDKLIGSVGDGWGSAVAARLNRGCHKILEHPGTFASTMHSNLPGMMLVFLPLIGLVLYLLHIGTGRYYVEHLLFVVHFHAFFFLGGVLLELLGLLVEATSGSGVGQAIDAITLVASIAFAVYVPIYLYRAMRRVYGQRHLVTFIKYLVLGVGYLVCLGFSIVLLLLYTTLTL